MARLISITAPPQMTDLILEQLKTVEHLLELQVFRGASVAPAGDVIKLAVPNRSLNRVMRLLDNHHLGQLGGLSLSTSDVESYVPTSSRESIERDNNEATWEEMEMTISNDTNTSLNTLLTMFTAGVLAVVGIATNTLHIVVGGMLVAPGFMPLVRIALAHVGRRGTWRYGVADFAAGYLALIVGAAVTSLAMQALGYNPLLPSSTYYSADQPLIRYWTTYTTPSVLSSAAAAVAGALLVATKKSVFTSGVMIGLALVPTAAIIGVGIVGGAFALALQALGRFAIDAALVLVCSWIVLAWDKRYLHKRDLRM